MIHRILPNEPFANVKLEKRAYDLSDVDPENYRKQIKNYLSSLYPFLTSGLQNVNFKKQPDEEGNAIGTIVYENNGILITIPVIIDEHNLKEPTVGIYNGNIVPLDKEYLDYVMQDPEYGEQVSENELPANMQYLTQSGLFQDTDSGMYKGSSIMDTIFTEDDDNPYHYHGAILKKAADNTLSVDESIYCTSVDMLKMIKEAEDNKLKASFSSMASSEKVASIPIVQKISDSGSYKNVMADGKVQSAKAYCDLFSIEGGKAKNLIVIGGTDNMSMCQSPASRESEPHPPKWGYGEAYGSEFIGDVYGLSVCPVVTPDEATMRNVVFVRSEMDKKHSYETEAYSIPYYVEMTEDVAYGDGEKAKVMHVKSSNDDTKYKFILSDKVMDIRKVDKSKLKGSELRYLYNDDEDIYIIPSSYKLRLLGENKIPLEGYKDGYSDMIKELEEEFPNKMTVISKGANLYTVNVDSEKESYKYANLSGDAALLIANYYTGGKESSMSAYQPDTAYAFNGDITKKAVDRSYAIVLKRYSGEFKKLAGYLTGLSEITRKTAALEPIADSLVGAEAVIDDEHVDTTNILESVDGIIRKVGELLLMSRLGKNDLSESILSRSVYALVKLSNELRGMANASSL